jgi:hypothetical protein
MFDSVGRSIDSEEMQHLRVIRLDQIVVNGIIFRQIHGIFVAIQFAFGKPGFPIRVIETLAGTFAGFEREPKFALDGAGENNDFGFSESVDKYSMPSQVNSPSLRPRAIWRPR